MRLALLMLCLMVAPSVAADLDRPTPPRDADASTVESVELPSLPQPRRTTPLMSLEDAFTPEAFRVPPPPPPVRPLPGVRRRRVGSKPSAPRDDLQRAQYEPGAAAGPDPNRAGPVNPFSSYVADPPIDYSGPSPSAVADITARDGPQIPEPMVFDLVRGLGARQGELEVNVLNIVPFRGRREYEWAPEIEWAIFDGFAIEYEMPIDGVDIIAHKFAAQYTIGTAFDDAFIHGVQALFYYDVEDPRLIPTFLYLTGLRLDDVWSIFGMWGFTVGPQLFPFAPEPIVSNGTTLNVNLSVFANVTERMVLGIETNLARQLRGPTEFLLMPQVHYAISEHLIGQFGVGYADDLFGQFPQLAFRIIWER